MTQEDPVCGMMVDERKTTHISEVNGQKIYLCSADCKSQFDQNPSKYKYWIITISATVWYNILQPYFLKTVWTRTFVVVIDYSLPLNFLFIDSILPAYFFL